MTIGPFRTDDVAPFLELAALENWVAEPWEFEFLLAEFAEGCFTARADTGEAAGFVTALRHEQSGWIGNLIVAEPARGKGIGESLFKKAIEALQEAGAQTIWLTASESGVPLYEKHGFSSIDKIIRWIGTGRRWNPADPEAAGCDGLTSLSHDLDTNAWGDRREALLAATAHRGQLIQNESGLIVRQPCGNAVQFGPFAAADGGTAGLLVEHAFNSVTRGTKVLLDAPASNRSALQLFIRKKMRIAGSNVLMYAGNKPAYQPELIYGLATMGSCG